MGKRYCDKLRDAVPYIELLRGQVTIDLNSFVMACGIDNFDNMHASTHIDESTNKDYSPKKLLIKSSGESKDYIELALPRDDKGRKKYCIEGLNNDFYFSATLTYKRDTDCIMGFCFNIAKGGIQIKIDMSPRGDSSYVTYTASREGSIEGSCNDGNCYFSPIINFVRRFIVNPEAVYQEIVVRSRINDVISRGVDMRNKRVARHGGRRQG